MRRIRCTIAYDGTEFHGWQTQPGLPTIQGTLEKIVSEIEGKPVHVAGSGRTDAGVHALAQVAAFSLENPIPPYNLRKAINRLLAGQRAHPVGGEAHADFHPRYDAVAKTYEYRIHRAEVLCRSSGVMRITFPIPWKRKQSWRPRRCWKGSTIFSAFAASDDSDREGKSKVRTIFSSRRGAPGIG